MTESKPLVSILINNYNYGRFLPDAIDSALGQTYPHTETIVVDDGSTDDSREIISSYGRRIIPVLKENGGQASALNAGFAASRGSLICYLDSDDIWVTAKTERIVEAALKHPGAVFIYHRVQPVSPGLESVGNVIPPRLLQGDIAARVQKCGGWWASSPTSGLCATRDALQRVGPIPEEEFRLCADAFLSYLLPLLGQVVGLPESLALYRLHGANNYNSAAALKRSRGHDTLLGRAASYEKYVASVNQRLRTLRMSAVLDLKGHWNYQFAKYLVRAPEKLSLSRFLWRTLCYPGQPSATRRFRMAAAVIRNGLWSRVAVPKGRESA